MAHASWKSLINISDLLMLYSEALLHLIVFSRRPRSLYNPWKTKWGCTSHQNWGVWCGGNLILVGSVALGLLAFLESGHVGTGFNLPQGFLPCALNIISVGPLAWVRLRWISDRRMKNQSVNQATRFLSSGPMSQAYWTGVGLEIDQD